MRASGPSLAVIKTMLELYMLTGQNLNVCLCKCAVCMSLGGPCWLWWTLTCWKASWWRSASPTSPTDGWELSRLNIEQNKSEKEGTKDWPSPSKRTCVNVFLSQVPAVETIFSKLVNVEWGDEKSRQRHELRNKFHELKGYSYWMLLRLHHI